MTSPTDPAPTPAPDQPVDAETITTGVLVIATGVILYLCYRVVQPFMPALAWALALAVVAHPLDRWLERKIKARNLSAALTVTLIVLLLFAPMAFVTHSLVDQASRYARVAQEGIRSGRWQQAIEENRYIGPLARRISSLSESPSTTENENRSGQQPGQGADDSRPPGPQSESTNAEASTNTSQETADDSPAGNTPQKQETADHDSESDDSTGWSPFGFPSSGSLASAAGMVTSRVGSILSGAGWVGMQLLITVMCLFFFLRDRRSVLGGLRSLLPLSESEADRILCRINDTIYATIFGSLTVAFVQGAMGGLMFWMLGIPSPLFWGAIMGLLAVVPILGTFVIWAPTAAWLAMQGDWNKALILVGWGALAIGLIDNLLYPFLVGNRMRFHTLLVFFAIVGGLTVFGAAGIILGPVLLAVTDGLLQVWQRRIDRARQAA